MDIISRQIWLRIKVSVAAYAYEICNETYISDGEYDKLAQEIDPSISTVRSYNIGNEKLRIERLDAFFRDDFSDYTGQWIHKHPELDRVERLYRYGRWQIDDYLDALVLALRR